MMNVITLSELENTWNFEADKKIENLFNSYDLKFKIVDNFERDKLILDIIKVIDSQLKKTGVDRYNDWEIGWNENLLNFIKSNNTDDLYPKYFNKYPIVRWKQQFIKPMDGNFEPNLLHLLILVQIHKYVDNFDALYEFGCGTGHNLLNLRKSFTDAALYGLDWTKSSQNIISRIATITKDFGLFGINFDYFEPDFKINLDSNSVVLTVASLEQTGNGYMKFLEFLISKRPKIVIHIEPVWESLDDDTLIDYLSILYMKKRNYLNGFFNALESLEKQGKISIKNHSRSYLGSKFIDGYTVIVWTLA